MGLAVGTMTAVLMSILGVRNSIGLGVLAGVLEFIPIFGPWITAIVSVGLVIVLMAALVWLANQVNDNFIAFSVLVAGTVVLAYSAFLFTALSMRLIDQNTFSKLSLGLFKKIPAFNPAKADGDDD